MLNFIIISRAFIISRCYKIRVTLIKFSLTLDISKAASCSLSRAFELQETNRAPLLFEPRPTYIQVTVFRVHISFSSTLFAFYIVSARRMSRHPVNAYHIYIIYRDSQVFYHSSCPVFLASPSISLSGIYISDVVNGNDDGICWHDLLQGGEEGAPATLLSQLEASNVFFRRLYTQKIYLYINIYIRI